MSAPERYAVGTFVVDVPERLLLREGVAVPLPGKVFDTLVVLLRNPGRLVTKEELMTAVWPETHVSDNNLLHNISLIRAAVNEPEWIRTIPRRGYRLTAEVRLLADQPQRGRRVWPISATAVAAIIVIGVAIAMRLHATVPPPHSIAVLPFESLNVAPDQSYIAASFASSIANRLAAIHGITVRPAGTAVRVEDPASTARRLEVESVLTGHVEPDHGALRVMAELFDSRARHIVWSRTFQIPSSDVPAVQDAIAFDVGTLLAPGLTDDEKAQLTPPRTKDRVAADAYLRGRELLDRRMRFDESAAYLQLATERDPHFALAWAALAEAIAWPIRPRTPAEIAYATAAARRAIALDAANADAHATLGFIRMFHEWDSTAAERELRVALRLKPESARFHDWLGIVQLTRGDFAEAEAEVGRARAIDPASSDIAGDLWIVEYMGRRFAAAERAARAELAMTTNPQVARLHVANSLEQQHRYREALVEDASAPPNAAYAEILRFEAAYDISRDEVVASIRGAEANRADSPVGLAGLYARMGERDAAIRCLARAVDERDFGIIFAAVEPVFDSLRDDPRFNDVLRRAGFDAARNRPVPRNIDALR